jgi:hypothetical protein
MKFNIPAIVEIDVKYVQVSVPVRYEKEDIPNDFPFRENDQWRVTIDAETGYIKDWPVDRYRATYSIHMKVCDQGIYRLLDSEEKELASLEDGYVPSFFPGEHFGDYIIFDIASDGKILNWKKLTQKDIDNWFGETDD